MDNPSQTPAPETLNPRTDEAAPASAPAPAAQIVQAKPGHRRSFRPSHRATLIGMGAVIAILAVNGAIIGLVLKKQNNANDLAAKGQVAISTSTLNQLGVNRSQVGDSGVLLTVAPDAQFKGKLSVAGATTLSGSLLINSNLTATNANLTQLQAGNASLSQLNVNGDGTLSTLNLRKDLVVAGVTQLQGAVTIGQLLTVNNNLDVLGNLSINGTFSAHSLSSTSTLTVGGHVVTTGSTPGISRGGSALGSNGTVSISGDDSAGRVAINIGASPTGGTLATVTFINAYGNIPRVVITPIGVGGEFYVFNVGTGGFSIGVNDPLPIGGWGIDYIVEQ
ncbi:MAG: hypothetical protein ACREGG_02070 [Candidatus Saccharimonadales bacterium]